MAHNQSDGFSDQYGSWFSAKGTLSMGAISMAMLGFANQIQQLTGFSAGWVVMILSTLAAVLFGISAYTLVDGQSVASRIGFAMLTSLVAWDNLFQATRGRSHSYALAPQEHVEEIDVAEYVPQSEAGIVDLNIDWSSYLPSDCNVRTRKKSGVCQALVILNGRNVWVPAVTTGKGF